MTLKEEIEKIISDGCYHADAGLVIGDLSEMAEEIIKTIKAWDFEYGKEGWNKP